MMVPAATIPTKCQHLFFSFLTITAAILIFTKTAHPVMPPEFYAEQAKASKIKAIASVTEVRILSEGSQYNFKVVTFRLEHALTRGVPAVFTGSCKSVDTREQNNNIMTGGDIYHYPHVEDRVFVTISDNGGIITTMTSITPELEDAVHNDPGRIRYRFGRVTLKTKEPPMPVPVIRGKEPLPEDQIPQIKLLDVFANKQELPSQSYGHGDIRTIIPPVQPKQSAKDIQGQFIVALGNDDIQEAQRFINQGANVNNAIGQTGQTMLMLAESRSMAKLLVKMGADIKARDLKGGSVLHYAVTRKNAVALIRFFTDHGVDPNLRSWLTEPAIFIACQYFHETRAFDNSNLSAGQNGENVKGPSPKATLAALVNAGADINIRDDVGNTLLMSAVTWDNRDLVLLLLELGADKNLDRDGQTAKDMAYDMGHRAIYQVLE